MVAFQTMTKSRRRIWNALQADDRVYHQGDVMRWKRANNQLSTCCSSLAPSTSLRFSPEVVRRNRHQMSELWMAGHRCMCVGSWSLPCHHGGCSQATVYCNGTAGPAHTPLHIASLPAWQQLLW